MTVSSDINRSGPYFGDDVTLVLPYDFKIEDGTHINVVVRDNDDEFSLVLGAQYSVSGVGDEAGGEVILAAPLRSGRSIVLLRKSPFKQETDLENQGAYYAETVERALARIMHQT